MTAAPTPNDRLPSPGRFRTDRGVRALVEHTSDLIMVVDDGATVLYASSAARRILGRDPSEFLGTSAFDLLHPDDIEKAADVLRRATHDTETHAERVRLRATHADGTFRHVELSAHNLLDDPEVGGIVVTARDVTGQVEAEAALVHSEQRFRALAQHASDLVTICDAEGVMQYVSPSVHHLLGYEADALIGSSAEVLMHPEDRDRVAASILEQFETGREPHPIEYRLVHRDGSVRHVEGITTNLLNDPAVAGVVSNSHDVTADHDATQRLEAITERFQGIVDNASDAIVSLDAEQRIVLFNNAAEQIFEYERSKVLGQPLDMLLPRHVKRAHHGLVEAFAADPTVSREMNNERPELTGRRRDNSEFPAEITISKIDQNGELLLTAIVRDVTERRRHEDVLEFRAKHDVLTNLANRVLFQEKGEKALALAERSGAPLAVIYLDLDRFKAVNDTYGHPAGDELLRIVADRLTHSVRTGDLVARFGGDEFAVLCVPGASAQQMAAIGTSLIKRLSEPVTLADGTCTSVGASAGIALGGRGTETIDLMMRDADIALYRAKHAGRGRAVVFGSSSAAAEARQASQPSAWSSR